MRFLSPENYNELTHLRKKFPNDKSPEAKSYAPAQLTSVDMKLSANQFSQMISSFGYPVESQKVLTFLKGVGEYDFGTKQYYFTIRSLHKYREMMIQKIKTSVDIF